jgi:RHS repeat-associated protein
MNKRSRFAPSTSRSSVRGTVNSAGSLTGTTSYDAWGNPETSGGLTATPFGLAGGYTDPDGLIYLLNRYYNPATGQFISVDPDLNQTLEPYGYAGDNPVSSKDPTGDPRWVWWPNWYIPLALYLSREETFTQLRFAISGNIFSSTYRTGCRGSY